MWPETLKAEQGNQKKEACRQWVSRVRSKASTDLARMEFALTSSKTGLRKEAIRLNHIELARHHLATGNLQVSSPYNTIGWRMREIDSRNGSDISSARLTETVVICCLI